MSHLTRIALFLILPITPALASEADTLRAEIQRHAEDADVTIYMAAIHLGTGEVIDVNGRRAFPLASTYKVPIAARALALVEEGQLALDTMIDVRERERSVGSHINQSFPHPGVSLSLLNLLEPLLVHSDNTATDVVLRAIGGVEHMTGWLRDIGVEDLRVDRGATDSLRDYFRIPYPDDEDISLLAQFNQLVRDGVRITDNSFDDHDPQALYDDYLRDPRDQGSAVAMAQFLETLWSGDLLNERHTQLLKDIMSRCSCKRLSANLPAAALPIPEKGGSLTGNVSSVGVLTMPSGDDVVMVVHTSGAPSAHLFPAKDQVIAKTARSVYDYFLDH